jgi:hypothetical protein
MLKRNNKEMREEEKIKTKKVDEVKSRGGRRK